MNWDDTRPGNSKARSNSSENEEDRRYYNLALQWFLYDNWSIDEAANLFAGCLPQRQMLQPGAANEHLDEKVLESENKIRRALHKPLTPLNEKEYFAPLSFSKSQLMEWALEQKLALPPLLLDAYNAHINEQQKQGYSTPCTEAVKWTCDHFWQHADYREPPGQGEIVQALLQRFKELDHDECIMVEHICRHPLIRTKDDT